MSEPQVDRKRTTLFFAGTDTNVGKTFIAALAARRFREAFGRPRELTLGVYKPVASGCCREGTELVADDAIALWDAAGRPKTLGEVCPQRFEAPLSPTQAARREGKTVDSGLLREGARCWEDDCDLLIVEGSGGLMSPLANGVLNVDLAKQFERFKLIVVAANRLGAIHQTLATCAAARHAGVEPTGIILCQVDSIPDASTVSNATEIAEYSDVPVLGSVGHGAESQDVAFFDDLFT